MTVNPPSHMPALDGLRGVAILLVAFSHFGIVLSPSEPIEAMLRSVLWFGWCGVDLFFVLSGFLITGILLDTKHSEGYFRNFYMRRVLRIFPLYFAFLGFVFLIIPLVLRPNPVAGVNAAWYLVYLQNWKGNHGASDPFLGHFWSLAVEEQFYLLWPLVVLLTSRRRLAIGCVVLAVLALACRTYLSAAGVDAETICRLTPCRVDALAPGALVALAVRDKNLCDALSRVQRTLILVGGAVVTGVLAAGGPRWQSPLQHTVGITGLAIVFAGTVFAVSTKSAGRLSSLFLNAKLRSIGKYSYGIYVFHMLPNRIAYQAVAEALTGKPVIVALTAKVLYIATMTAFVYLLAFVSYRLFESRFLALKEHFTYRPAEPKLPPIPFRTEESFEGSTL